MCRQADMAGAWQCIIQATYGNFLTAFVWEAYGIHVGHNWDPSVLHIYM